MNAVLLKELRQSVRNRYVLAAYIIFIVVLLIVAGVQTSLSVRESWETPQAVFRAGKALFLTIHGIFAVLTVVFVPTYVLSRITRERWGTDLDLMYVTPMPPCALLIGKFVSALALAGLFLSAALPFLALSYFIGGIDVLSIVMSFLLTLELFAVFTLYAIVIAISPMPKILRGVVQIGYVLSLIGSMMGWLSATYGLCESGYGNIFGDVNTCIALVEAMAAGLSVAGLLYAAALAGFRPPSADRMRPFRILATVLVIVWGGIVWFQSRYGYFHTLPQVWVTLLMLFAAGMLVVGLGERAGIGRRPPPRSLPVRILGYPFRAGQFNAVCWALLLLAAGLILSYYTEAFYSSSSGLSNVHVTVLNISGYALTMLALFRWILRPKMMPNLWWVTGVVILIMTAILGPMSAGGVDGIDHMVGYLFAEHVPMVQLYVWNIAALLCLVPAVIVDSFRK